MRKLLIAGAMGVALAGIGHNLPPVAVSTPVTTSHHFGILPRRIVDENRRNQKLKQKLRRMKRRQYVHDHSRAQRKTRKFGTAYRPGKLFKGHRI